MKKKAKKAKTRKRKSIQTELAAPYREGISAFVKMAFPSNEGQRAVAKEIGASFAGVNGAIYNLDGGLDLNASLLTKAIEKLSKGKYTGPLDDLFAEFFKFMISKDPQTNFDKLHNRILNSASPEILFYYLSKMELEMALDEEFGVNKAGTKKIK